MGTYVGRKDVGGIVGSVKIKVELHLGVSFSHPLEDFVGEAANSFYPAGEKEAGIYSYLFGHGANIKNARLFDRHFY